MRSAPPDGSTRVRPLRADRFGAWTRSRSRAEFRHPSASPTRSWPTAREVVARDGKTILSYGAGNGYAPLREVIGEWHGVPASQVLLTNGGLQGFVLLVQYLARGKSVFVELPTYDRPLKILNEVGSPIVTMAMDDNGLIPGCARQCAEGEPHARLRLHDPDLSEPEWTDDSRGSAPRDRRARPGRGRHAPRGRSLRADPLRGHCAAFDVRARAGVGDLHFLVLEDDLALVSGSAGTSSRRAWRVP